MSNGDDLLEIDVAEDSHELEIALEEGEFSCAITIELDDKLNAGRSCFEPGENFWIKVFSPVATVAQDSTNGYILYSTGGSVTLANSNVVEQIPDPENAEGEEWEYVNFSDWSGSASRPVYGMIENHWCFHILGAVQWKQFFTDLFVRKPENSTDLGISVLRMKYQTKYDSWKVTAPTAGHDIKIIAYATGTENVDDEGNFTCRAELQVTIREDCDVLATVKDITIKTVNCESDEALPGVSVFIEDDFKGTTGVDGTLFVGKFGSGEYSIRFEHPDYWPSGTDGVLNDTFVVD
ncbi:hypothetical protein LCGC14_1163630 [marine sediment metagenome]|uniref:Uncharacterized protein n=1 Tax=marine sediment metagenome TaxID=412755 RepID=A0A0F9MF01_9ZZZZ